MTSSANPLPFINLRISRRAIIFSAAAIFLHLLAMQLLAWRNWQVPQPPVQEKTIQINLRAASETPLTMLMLTQKRPAQPTPRQPIKRVLPGSSAVASTAIAATSVAAQDVNALVADASIVPGVAESRDEPNMANMSVESKEAVPEPSPETTSQQAPARYATRAPESAQLNMKVVRTEPNRNPMYGVATLKWEMDDNKYRMSIEVGLDLLFTSVHLYTLTSNGLVREHGLMPRTSTEERRTRAETATHFDHDGKSLSFSSSNKEVPLLDGAQDKASFIMQLAAIGNADASQFSPGKEINMQVAEERDASVFQFLVVGEEELDTKLGKLRTWHLLRAPKPGSYNSRLDVWLAPSTGWYPVQIRNTESNGSITTQTITEIIQKPQRNK
jgi:hypothetical protein